MTQVTGRTLVYQQQVPFAASWNRELPELHHDYQKLIDKCVRDLQVSEPEKAQMQKYLYSKGDKHGRLAKLFAKICKGHMLSSEEKLDKVSMDLKSIRTALEQTQDIQLFLFKYNQIIFRAHYRGPAKAASVAADPVESPVVSPEEMAELKAKYKVIQATYMKAHEDSTKLERIYVESVEKIIKAEEEVIQDRGDLAQATRHMHMIHAVYPINPQEADNVAKVKEKAGERFSIANRCLSIAIFQTKEIYSDLLKAKDELTRTHKVLEAITNEAHSKRANIGIEL